MPSGLSTRMRCSHRQGETRETGTLSCALRRFYGYPADENFLPSMGISYHFWRNEESTCPGCGNIFITTVTVRVDSFVRRAKMQAVTRCLVGYSFVAVRVYIWIRKWSVSFGCLVPLYSQMLHRQVCTRQWMHEVHSDVRRSTLARAAARVRQCCVETRRFPFERPPNIYTAVCCGHVFDIIGCALTASRA